jgi:hypothetical protein
LLFLSHIIDVAFLSSIRLTAGVKGNKIALEMKSKCREKKREEKKKGGEEKGQEGEVTFCWVSHSHYPLPLLMIHRDQRSFHLLELTLIPAMFEL